MPYPCPCIASPHRVYLPQKRSGLTANNIWAVGENDSSSMQNTLVKHWNGKAWRIVSSPNSGTSGSTLVASVSSNDLWAVGTTTSSSSTSGYQPLIEHWNGTQWSISSSSALSGRLFSVATVGPNDAWALAKILHRSRICVCHMQNLRIYPDALLSPSGYNESVRQGMIPVDFRYP